LGGETIKVLARMEDMALAEIEANMPMIMLTGSRTMCFILS